MTDVADGSDAPSREIKDVDLALSGGGFRATLFHLGVIACLREANLLLQLRTICSVSGGSILAGHLVCHWDDYLSKSDERFRFRVSQLANSIMSRNVSGNVLSKSTDRLIDFKPLDTERLADEYLSLLDLEDVPDRWDELTNGPDLYVLTTHLNTGQAAAFCKDGLLILPVDESHRHHAEIRALADFAKKASIKDQSVARAVAASSAFPPAFSPLSLVPDDATHMLTDGGVYDNSGVNFLRHLYETSIVETSQRLVVVSDAGRDFPTELRGQYDSFMALALRVTDTQGGRIAEMDSAAARSFFDDRSQSALFLSIHDTVPPLEKDLDNHSEKVQRLLRTIRTELDDFSAAEVFVLFRHGYRVALKALIARGLSLGQSRDPSWTPTDLPDRNLRALTKDDIESRLAASHAVKKEIRGALVGTLKKKLLRDYRWQLIGVCLLCAVLLSGIAYSSYRLGAPDSVNSAIPTGKLEIDRVVPSPDAEWIKGVPVVAALAANGSIYALSTESIGQLTENLPSSAAAVSIHSEPALQEIRFHWFFEHRSNGESNLIALQQSGVRLRLPAASPRDRLVAVLVNSSPIADVESFVKQNLVITIENP